MRAPIGENESPEEKVDMDSVDDLYQEVILDSSKDTTYRGNLRDRPDSYHVALKNPLCGDTVELWIVARDGIIEEVRFEGIGCSISQAATSLMAERIRGKTFAEARQLAGDFRAMLQGTTCSSERADDLGDLTALRGVQRFPQRAKCATLGFEALERTLAKALDQIAPAEAAERKA